MEVHGIGLASFDNDFIEPDMSIGSAVLSGYFCGNRAEVLDRVLSVFIVGDEMIQIVRGKFLEKSQMSGIDTDDGAFWKVAGMDGFQQRSILWLRCIRDPQVFSSDPPGFPGKTGCRW